MALLLLLLSLGLVLAEAEVEAEAEGKVNISERQGVKALQCYSCEAENSFGCKTSVTCTVKEKFCVIAVTKIFPRFYIVSKQCSQYCPVIPLPPPPPPPPPKTFILEKPTPFPYIRCCDHSLCNDDAHKVNESTFREIEESISEAPASLAWFTRPLTLAFVVLGPSLV
ncbi:lymphocyte antigen 6K [Tenrec ecaudatus]|uniref:lymphocyte antigen 6K n=1 Tax=Tenrec ecaudatus TaxID=94439 RepID=UPI003F5A3FBA